MHSKNEDTFLHNFIGILKNGLTNIFRTSWDLLLDVYTTLIQQIGSESYSLFSPILSIVGDTPREDLKPNVLIAQDKLLGIPDSLRLRLIF